MKPHFKTNLGELYNNDCLEQMKEIQNESIDMILCDLPYGTTNAKWDVVIPFEKLWEQYERIIKTNGAIVLFGSEPFSSMLRLSNLKRYKYDWIWKKEIGTGHLNAKKQPMRDNETISVFYKTQCLYIPQFTQGKAYITTAGKSPETYNPSEVVQTISDGNRYPKTVLEFETERTGMHPTQKPVDLLAYLIRTYTNEFDTVLDNTSGSGSTAVACEQNNRKWICIEKEIYYCDVTVKRLVTVQQQLF